MTANAPRCLSVMINVSQTSSERASSRQHQRALPYSCTVRQGEHRTPDVLAVMHSLTQLVRKRSKPPRENGNPGYACRNSQFKTISLAILGLPLKTNGITIIANSS